MEGWKSKIDEKTGMIYYVPGNETLEESLAVLGRALCRNTRALALRVGVPENLAIKCHEADGAGIVAAEYNLALVNERLKEMSLK